MFAVDHHPHPPSYCTAVNLSRWYARLIKLLGEHQAGNIAQAEAEARERKKLTPAVACPGCCCDDSARHEGESE